jgi:dTDP-4-amino-4,6-dideoxygalactose transaminase
MSRNIYVTRSSLPKFEEFVEEIKPLWESAYLTNMGEKHNLLENKLKEYLGVRNISLLTNGHMALELGIQAMNLSGEVITTPFTFASTTHAIVRNGMQPIFCDINKNDYTIDVNKIESLITDKTSAILPVHVFGNVCDVISIEQIAKKHKLKVIYDAAHTFGEKYDGKSVVEYGDMSILSFHATKVFNTIEGGAAITNDINIIEELYRLKNFGIKSETVVDGIGSNAKMDEFRAAMGICNLRYINNEISQRRVVVERYRENLENVSGITLCKPQPNVESNYSYFPVVFNSDILGITRDEVYDELKKKGIYARKYFYPLTSSFDCYKGKFEIMETPNANYISDNILTLPLYSNINLQDIDRICEYIISIINL